MWAFFVFVFVFAFAHYQFLHLKAIVKEPILTD